MNSERYLAWIREQDCCMCYAPGPNDPHHLKGLGHYSGIGKKAPDIAAMPLCRRCHNRMHEEPELWINQWDYLARTIIEAANQGIIDYGQKSET